MWIDYKVPVRMLSAYLTACTLAASFGCSQSPPTRPTPFPRYRNLDAIPSWSPDGRSIAYLHEPRGSADIEHIAIVDVADGSTRALTVISPRVSPQIAWSPDGTRIAYYHGGISTLEIETHTTRLWTGPSSAYPAWSPDGRFLIYLITLRRASAPDSTAGLHIIDTHVGDERALIRDGSKTTFGSYPVWSPNGSTIAFMSNESATGGNICCVEKDGTRYRQITRLSGWCADLQWSADGQRIYFHFTPGSATFGNPAVTKSWVVNEDGTDAHQLPFDLGDPRVHFWFQFSIGPEDRVAYSGLDPTGSGGVIWTMNVDGTERCQITVP